MERFMASVGVVGLGNMGFGMASTLKREGVPVQGFDRSPSARGKAVEAGIPCVESLGDLCACCDVLILSLPNAAIVEAVTLGAGGVLEHGKSGLLVLETSTSEAAVTRKIAKELEKKGITLVDAPVSGGPNAAHAGTMTMLLGGTDKAIAQVKPYTDILGATVVHVGGTGAGHVAKLANNMLCAANLILVGEALRLGQEAGVAPNDILAGINAGSGRSAVSEVNFPRWVLNGAFDSGFSMGLMRKDVGLAKALADEVGLDLPMLENVSRIWRETSKATIDDGEDFNRIVTLGASDDLFSA